MEYKDNLLVSIIIPTYNRADLILLTLESIKSQTFIHWECIIVDDGSADDSLKTIGTFIRSDSRFKLFSRPLTLKKGPSSCRNYGYSQSIGSHIQFFDSDDLMHPDMLKKKVAPFKGDPKLSFSACNFFKLLPNQRSINLSIKTEANDEPLIDRIITYKISFGTPIPLWSRKSLENEPFLFDVNFEQSEDLELYSRVLIGKSSYSFIEEPLFSVRVHENSSSHKTNAVHSAKHILDIVEVYQKICNRQSVRASTKLFMLTETLRYLRIALYKRKGDVVRAIIIILNSGTYKIKNRFKFGLLKLFLPIFLSTGKGIYRFKWLFKIY